MMWVVVAVSPLVADAVGCVVWLLQASKMALATINLIIVFIVKRLKNLFVHCSSSLNDAQKKLLSFVTTGIGGQAYGAGIIIEVS